MRFDPMTLAIPLSVAPGDRCDSFSMAEGKYEGRAPTARAKASEVRRVHGESMGTTEIAKRLRISRASVYRVSEPAKGAVYTMKKPRTGGTGASPGSMWGKQ